MQGVLDHDEERRLSEIEAVLRLDDPDLWLLFDQSEIDEALPALAGGGAGRSRRHRVLTSLALLAAAIIATTVVTLVAGPDLGGLVAVLGLTGAGMFAYQVLRGCPGMRNRGQTDR